MEKKIPPLNYNPKKIPECIWNYFCSMGFNNNGKLIAPFKRAYTQLELRKYTCYPLERHYYEFEAKLDNGLIHDNKGNKLTQETIEKYLISYANGFEEGYSEFINSINETKGIPVSDENKIHKIFEMSCSPLEEGRGNLSTVKTSFQKKDFEAEPENEEQFIKDINVVEYITTDLFFQKGIEGGEIYKAWEIVLKNQGVFEPMFEELVKPPPKKKEITSFVDCLKHDHPDQLAQMLKDSFAEMKRPKQVALFIFGLDALKLLKTETIKRSELLKSIENYFEIDSFKPSALNKYINYKFKNDNVERHIDNDEINKTAERIVLIKNRLL
ncbi:MAG: hypothetical protein V2I62_08590 [Bacteroidales bacterium]|jgi:hypothetical protein|nr:hypothetical protein [Bacteroidales bacterium]